MKVIEAPPPSKKTLTDRDVRRAVERGRTLKRLMVYTFTLRCKLPTDGEDPRGYVERLVTAGCTDATIRIGRRGHIALAFDRASHAYADAVASAIREVAAAIPGARQIEVVAARRL